MSDWLAEARDRHRGGRINAGKCLSCRRTAEACPGGRYRNECPHYVDNSPTQEEHIEGYAELVRRLCEAETEPARGDLEGAAMSRRRFLRGILGISEKRLRGVEDALHVLRTEENIRSIRRLRWEL